MDTLSPRLALVQFVIMNNVRMSLRFIGLGLGLLLGLTAGNVLSTIGDSNDTTSLLLGLGVAVGGIGYLIGPHVSRSVLVNGRKAVADASALDIVAIAMGLAFGALISAALALPLSFLPEPAGTFLPLIVAATACAGAVAVVWMRKAELVAPFMRGKGVKSSVSSTPTAPIAAGEAAAPQALILDTNVIIDGRINHVVGTGFLNDTLFIPRFVLDELQWIADSDDPMRRVRGRRGLDTLNKLRAERPEQIVVLDDLVPEEREVDAKLVRLAKARGGRVLTNDYNLNKVAQLQGVTVLNLNELTNALRPLVLPGEEISLKVVQEGREAGQGVGFLDDGTMVVVDGGRPLVGKQTSVTVTRLLQTGAGRMVFATPKHAVS